MNTIIKDLIPIKIYFCSISLSKFKKDILITRDNIFLNREKLQLPEDKSEEIFNRDQRGSC